MKTFIHIITHHWKILVFAFLAIGCSDYLGESPDNRIQLTEIEDYKALVTNAYPGAYHLFTEIMTDNYKYYDYPGTNNITIVEWFKPMYIWSDKYMQILAVGPARAWEYYYGEIYKTNEVLKGIDNAEGKDEELRNQVKGEALLLRAYCHFMLVNLFGKQYNASTAATDLGVPYATKPQEDNVAEYPRDNIKDVYDWIERDALEGVALLVDKKVNVPKYHLPKLLLTLFSAASTNSKKIGITVSNTERCHKPSIQPSENSSTITTQLLPKETTMNLPTPIVQSINLTSY